MQIPYPTRMETELKTVELLLFLTNAALTSILCGLVWNSLKRRMHTLGDTVRRNGSIESAVHPLSEEIRDLTRRVESNEISWTEIYNKMFKLVRSEEQRQRRARAKDGEESPSRDGDVPEASPSHLELRRALRMKHRGNPS